MMDVSGADWRKSSYSGGNNDCVEMARGEFVARFRDSKNPEGPTLKFSTTALTSFLAAHRQD